MFKLSRTFKLLKVLFWRNTGKNAVNVCPQKHWKLCKCLNKVNLAHKMQYEIHVKLTAHAEIQFAVFTMNRAAENTGS